ncbi:hypothetical protein AVV36_gp071 [Pectobacterium bacteriophage PM2]|uniref:Uncharacterized protein n=1 Tax=Pectobacterium bacteriophage PM2 TaxID=1429794 RepID=A0A0A0Q0J6_9CAUD|nr:hypothetical protein AVV36_gp071 [Pectobacterium bacteriophage PM2]AHY25033.1 hypothetical protein PM2_071 [Pectobacterium bacteriophage PM2]
MNVKIYFNCHNGLRPYSDFISNKRDIGYKLCKEFGPTLKPILLKGSKSPIFPLPDFIEAKMDIDKFLELFNRSNVNMSINKEYISTRLKYEIHLVVPGYKEEWL